MRTTGAPHDRAHSAPQLTDADRAVIVRVVGFAIDLYDVAARHGIDRGD
ncbi:MAG: hypothetical protein ACYDC9_09735 [Dermatophilaceae bacterium]